MKKVLNTPVLYVVMALLGFTFTSCNDNNDALELPIDNSIIKENVIITSNYELEAFLGLGVTEIHGSLSISDFPAEEIKGFEQLTMIKGDLHVIANDNLKSMKGFENLTSVGGDLIFLSNDLLTSIEDFFYPKSKQTTQTF